MEEKQCSKCKELKAVNEFSIHKATKDGLNSVCKPCKRKVTTLYRDNNREKVREQWNKHYTLTKKKSKPITPLPSNTPITRRIGVILCSKSKQDYACSVREMYDLSVSFKARAMFMDLAYDEWYVNTSKYGFMSPDKVIEPYDSWYIRKTHKTQQLKDNNNILTPEMKNDWLELVKSQFPDKDSIELHCHLSKDYYTHLSKIFPHTIYVTPQKSLPTTGWKYHDAIIMYQNGATLDECIKFLSEPNKRSRPPETIKTFYHPIHGEYYGNGYSLARTYNIDNGCAYGLSMGSVNMTYGWVTDKSLLPHVVEKNGKYRMEKGYAKTNKLGQRMGLREALNKLNVPTQEIVDNFTP
jgi:hypothetical protein